MKLTAQQLIDRLAKMDTSGSCTSHDCHHCKYISETVNFAIEAIETLQKIADEGGGPGWRIFDYRTGRWCADKAKAAFHE